MIDLVARLFNLTNLQAAQKLASDFGLDPKPPTAAAMVKPKRPYIRQFREDEILNGTFTEGRPAIVRSRLPVVYNPDAPVPVIWLNFLDGLLHAEDIPTLEVSCIGKILLLSFDGDEENLIESVISILDAGREKFIYQEINLKSDLQHKGIMPDLERRAVMRNNDEIALTYTEFEILQLLAQNPGRVFSKEQIYDIVWNEPYSGDYNIVMSHISHIREKIEDDPSHPVYIQTVWGVGYKFNEKICE